MASRRKQQHRRRTSQEASAHVSVEIRQTDMPEEMRSLAVHAAREAFASSQIEKDVAARVKKAFENKYPKTTWHCIVGKHFAASLTHATLHSIFLSVNNQTNVLLFKGD